MTEYEKPRYSRISLIVTLVVLIGLVVLDHWSSAGG